jgi:protein-S-isoprenylcysteine O-methyltransferase Ste14
VPQSAAAPSPGSGASPGETVDSVRYYLALILLMGLPPGLLLWLVIHPLARFWRRLGPGWTYTVLGAPTLALMAGVFWGRGYLLVTEFGTNVPLIALGVTCATAGVAIAVKRKKYLTLSILAGVPELSAGGGATLLTEGIYGRIRHPRYVEVFFWILAYAFVANYLALYITAVASLPVLYLIVILEERELLDRFGREYEEYRRRVPPFVPRKVGRESL